MIRQAALTLVVGLATYPQAAAQTSSGSTGSELLRADVSGVVGWLGHHPPNLQDAGDDWNNRLYGGIQIGYYWADHLKTEADIGVTSEGTSWLSTPSEARSADGFPIYTFERREYRDVKISIGQTWQFFRNRWAHPFVTGGMDFDRVHVRREIQFQSDPKLPPTARIIEERDWQPKAFAAAGVKMYFTSRAFARVDLHVGSGSGGQHIVWRIGLGKDF